MARRHGSSANGKRVVAIGASAGGVRALQRIAELLPADFAAPVLIVLHTGAHRSVLPRLLSARGPLRAAFAEHDEPLVAGRIYVAPPDMHLHVVDSRVRVGRGPKEHFARPAVDPLFRSVAIEHGAAAVGVILTGHLDDGTAGLQAIKAYGGVAIVQDPLEAEAPGMPRSARAHVEVDHCLPLEAIPALLTSLASAPTGARKEVDMTDPRATRAGTEHAIWLAQGDPMKQLDSIGAPSRLVCPECGGALWSIANADPARFRCHTGHAFSLATLHDTQATEADRALWTAIRSMQEKQAILDEMAARVDDTAGRSRDELIAESRRLGQQVGLLRGLVAASPPDPVE